LSFILTAAGVTFGGFLLPTQAYGVATDEGLKMVTRSGGFWGDATVAGICSISIVILPGLRTGFAIRAGLAAVQFACVLVSGKRLAILSLGLVSGFLFLGIKDRRRRIGALALGVLMIAALFVFLPDTGILDRFDEARSALTGERQDDERILRFSRAIYAIGQNPILGAGVGGVAWIHNGVLEILANMGVLGIPILISLVVPAIRSYRGEGLTNPWMAATLVYLLSPFMLEAVLNRPENLAFLGFFLGMTEAHQRLRWIESMRWRPRNKSVAATR
jgi:O-antigen ligase